MQQIRIHLLPASKLLKVQKGAALRDILFEHGVEFPCGGKGRCKGCRIRVMEGHLPVHEEERQRLSVAELASGWRMACLAHAEEDLKIEMAQWEAAILADESRFDFAPQFGTGVAVDLGTTTIACQLLDLQTGNVLAVNTALNSQAKHGADIMSRIEFAVAAGGQQTLQELIRKQIGEMIQQMLAQAGPELPPLQKTVLVGNTSMHHLFCGIDVEPLSRYPFEPADSGLHTFALSDLHWDFPGSPKVLFLPCLGGFVGSDILAGIVATGLHQTSRLSALMDLGTNGEIVVGNRDRLICASTAAGPAFEGARISVGMRAATGAIFEVRPHEGKLVCQTLGNAPARGVCGSGLVDAVAAARETGLVRSNGRLTSGESLPLVDSIALSQWDIRELQMAKGAISAGLRILLREWGATADDLECLYLAGAFGNYISLANGCRIGLLNVLISSHLKEPGGALVVQNSGDYAGLITRARRFA